MTIQDARPANPQYAQAIGYASPTEALGQTMLDAHADLIQFWLGPHAHPTRIGQGTYGSVFRVHMSHPVKLYFHKVFSSRKDFPHKVGSVADIPSNKYVAMKIIVMPPGKNDGGSLASILREIRTHWTLTHKEPIHLGGKEYDIRKVIPMLYVAGFDRRARAAIMFMDFMKGFRLSEYPAPRIPSVVVAHIEYAIVCLFLHGFLHIDFHPGNIFVDKHNRVKIFDFGFAATLQPRYIDEFKVYLQTHDTSAIDAFWHDIGEGYGDAAVLARRRVYPRTPTQWYRNITILEKLKTLVDNPAELEWYRHRIWVPTQVDFRHFLAFKKHQYTTRPNWNRERMTRRLAAVGVHF